MFDCSELNQNTRFIANNDKLQGQTSIEVPDELVNLLDLDISVLDLPELILLGLSVSCCLDKVPLGLLL